MTCSTTSVYLATKSRAHYAVAEVQALIEIRQENERRVAATVARWERRLCVVRSQMRLPQMFAARRDRHVVAMQPNRDGPVVVDERVSGVAVGWCVRVKCAAGSCRGGNGAVLDAVDVVCCGRAAAAEIAANQAFRIVLYRPFAPALAGFHERHERHRLRQSHPQRLPRFRLFLGALRKPAGGAISVLSCRHQRRENPQAAVGITAYRPRDIGGSGLGAARPQALPAEEGAGEKLSRLSRAGASAVAGHAGPTKAAAMAGENV